MGQNGSRVQDSTPDMKLSKLESQPSLDMNENKDKKLSKTMSHLSIGLILFWVGNILDCAKTFWTWINNQNKELNQE